MTTVPVTTTPAAVQAPAPQARRTRGLLKRLRPSRLAINLVLGAIALFWLVPTLSMMIISFRPAGLFEVSGWWKVFSAPSQLTLQNYKELFTGGSSTVLGGGVPSGLAPGSVLDAAPDLSRDQRARNDSRHGHLEPGCLFHRVRSGGGAATPSS